MKKLFTLILIGIMCVLVPGCQKKEPVSLEIGLLSNIDAIPFIIAQDKGYFDPNVKLTVFTSAQERDSAFQSGNIDGEAADVLTACFALEGDLKVKVTSMTDGKHVLVAGENSGINSISDLAAKKIAISSNTIIEFTLDSMLNNLGMEVDSVEKTPIAKIPERLEMLVAGQVDAGLFPEPFAASALLDGGYKLLTADEAGVASSIMLFKEDSIKDKKDEIKKMYEAYNKAVDFLQSNPRDAYMDLIIQKLSFPENVKESMELPVFEKARMLDEANVLRAVEWLHKKQLIQNKYTYNDIITMDFVK